MNSLAHLALFASIHQQAQAEAVCLNGESVTYRALDNAAKNIAAWLSTRSQQPEHCIGLFMGKTPAAIASIYGVLRAGAVYVPLDVKNPAQRIRYIIEQCQIDTFFTTPDQVSQLRECLMDYPVSVTIAVLTHEDWLAPSDKFHYVVIKPQAEPSEPFVEREIAPEQLATILYTSGSTGLPKGVMITHSAIDIFVRWVVGYFELQPHDRCISHAPLHFDLSLLDIFATHSAGAALVLVPDNMSGNPKFLAQYIAEQRITIWQSVPSVLVLLQKYGDPGKQQYPALRHVLFAGERISTSILEQLVIHFSAASFHNIYGATETNDTFIYSIAPGTTTIPTPLPIGHPLPYVDFLILDRDGQPVVPGEQGELLVKAPTMMRGYRNTVPASANLIEAGEHMGFYRTRDLVQQQPDGSLLFCGRQDDIVKTNGYRVNLLEIENVLQGHPAIRDVAVIPLPDDEIGNRIMAVISILPFTELSAVELKMFCAQRLPKYAIPHNVHIGTEPLPKTSSGKTNKQTLIKTRGQHVEIA